jgi:hypothetical protein
MAMPDAALAAELSIEDFDAWAKRLWATSSPPKTDPTED